MTVSIVINIGNSNIRFGLFNDDKCKVSWIINTKPYRTMDEFFAQISVLYDVYRINVQRIDKIIIGSVVPQLTGPISDVIKKIHDKNPIIVDRKTPSPIIHPSKKMGTDIYANFTAANQLYCNNRKKIILDFGTALSIGCMDEEANVLGVIIAPGVMTSLNALVQQTAQLPEIELIPPKSVLGNDTESAMRSGLIYGYAAMVEGFIDRINREIGDECFVIATGGTSHLYRNMTKKIHIEDKLHTVKGLYLLGQNIIV